MNNKSGKRTRILIIVFMMVILTPTMFTVSAFAEEESETGMVTAVAAAANEAAVGAAAANEAAAGAAAANEAESGAAAANESGSGSGEQLKEAAAGDAVVSGPVIFAEEKQLGEVQQIHLPFPDVTGEKAEWDFPYSDVFFSFPSEEFSITMARGSMGLTLSAFRTSSGKVSPQYETYLRGAGFTNIFSFGYDKPPLADSLSGVIGMKRIDDCTVIAAAACGQGYGNEWASNFIVGQGERHEGFSQAAGLFEDHLAQYLKEQKIEGKKKLWVSGFSRASAVGNILAADMIESGEFDDVYAYLFGVPRTTRQPVRYKGIYNICGQYDPVPSVPLQSWGYERYGTDLYTPAREADSDYMEFARSADEVGTRLDGKGFHSNPEVNYQLRLIVESLGEFFPDSDTYCKDMQDLLSDAVINRGDAHIFELLTTALKGFRPANSQERAKIDILIDYIGYIAGQHLRADQRQVEDGSWDPDETLAANLAHEHLPVTYVKWLFAEEDPQKILAGSVISRRVSVLGTVDVTVLKDGREITHIDKNGKISYPQGEGSEETAHGPGVFMMRNEKMTVISLPNDAEYYVKIDTDKRRTVSFYDLFISPAKLATEAGTINLGVMSRGSFGFRVEPDTRISPSLDEMTGNYTPLTSSDYDYSPTAVINDELEATRHYFMSISRIYHLVFNVVAGLILFLLASLTMSLIHRHQVKKGHPPFSKWYVIVPYLIFIANMTVLTTLLSYHLFVIDKARIICASLTVLGVALLSLRGTLRHRRKSSIVLTAFLFFCFAITFLFFNRTKKLPFSWVSVTAFALAIGIYTAAAVRTFREPSEDKSAE